MGLVLAGSFTRSADAQSLTFLSQTSVPNGAEILAYSSDENTVASTVAGDDALGVQFFRLQADGTLTPREFLSFASEFAGEIAAVSSVALDPLGRGFGVATLIPTANGTTLGRIAFFNYRTGSVAPLAIRTVGFHPDNVSFSRDGTKVFVANEGEFTTGGATDAPGSVSVIDISNFTSPAAIPGFPQAAISTIDFTAANLAPGVTLDALRFNDQSTEALANKFRHVEPEYVTEGEGKIFVTLQENNAIAELSLTGANANKFTAIYPLGFLTQTIDASDEDGPSDGPAALVDDVVKALPMPDTVVSFTAGAARYLVTANEGDFRVDDGDRARVKDFDGVEPGITIDTADSALGRLRVSTIDSDPDGNGLLNDVIMPGSRSFSIWNAATGALVADTGSLEPLLLSLDPSIHNIDAEDGIDTFDGRSDDKGPEPEAIATGVVNGRRYIFAGMERQNGILMFDAQNPANPKFAAYINNVADGLVAPESITVLPAAANPTGSDLLLIGYEVSGTIGVYRATGTPLAVPTIGGKSRFLVDAGERRVRIRGTASAGTATVLVNGVQAGATSWSATVPFRANKKRGTAIVTAISVDGVTTEKVIVLKRRK